MRYVVRDDPTQAAAAQALLDGEETIAISAVALAEMAWVLSSFYRVPRAELVDGLVELLAKRNVELLGLDKDLVASALLLCRDSGRVNIADALIYADVAGHGLSTFYSFDRRFPAEGIEVRDPR